MLNVWTHKHNKMEKIFEIKPTIVEFIPEIIEPGVLYISFKYETMIHLCACGCGIKTVTPIGDWNVSTIDEHKHVTLRPSIGNFSGERPNYHAHYFITDNKIDWL